jgi:hypothetical protein
MPGALGWMMFGLIVMAAALMIGVWATRPRNPIRGQKPTPKGE